MATCGVTPQAQNTGSSPSLHLRRIAEVGSREVADADRLGQADMHGRAVHGRESAR